MSLAISRRPAAVPREKRRSWLLAFATVCLALPLKMAGVGEFEIPLAMLVVLIGLPTMFSILRMPGGALLLAAAAFALVSLCAWDLSSGSANSFRPYFSYAFFFLPFVAYGSGYTLVRSREELRNFISLSSTLGALAGIGIAFTIALAGVPVRIEGDLQGSLLGLPLYATHGVNSLALTEFVLFALIWIDVLFQRTPRLTMLLLKVAGLAALTALILLSLSRGATVSLAVFILVSGVALFFREPKKAASVVAIAVVAGSYVVAAYGEFFVLAWSTRLSQSIGSAENSDANDLASGRLTLVNAAVADLEENPIFGVGFTGFHKGNSAFSETDALNSSPHNQYLTMLWKPGIVAGALLILFLFQRVTVISRLSKSGEGRGSFVGLWCLVATMLGVAAFTWDVLLVPNLGTILMFLFGACASIDSRKTLVAST